MGFCKAFVLLVKESSHSLLAEVVMTPNSTTTGESYYYTREIKYF